MIYDFAKGLAFSQSESHIKAVKEFLKREIPLCVDVVKTDAEKDKQGIDYIAKLECGAEIGIDEKLRRKGAAKYWSHGEAELALETWSVCPDETHKEGVEGWVRSTKTNVDYILYTFDPTDWDKAYLIPYQLLRMAFRHNGVAWNDKYHRKKQSSGDWESEAMFVPASKVLEAVAAEMHRGSL